MRFLSLGIAVFLAAPLFSNAAAIYLDPPFAELYRSDAVVASLRLDVDRDIGECINALDITIGYSGSIAPVDISLGRSIVPLWIEQPTINADSRTITMAGGIPNGYCGRVAGDMNLTNIIADIVFRLPGTTEILENPASVTIIAATAYLNDGFGTPVELRTFPAEYSLYDEAGVEIRDDWTSIVLADKTPPEPFDITLIKGGLETGGRWFIEFNTTDKQSGISHYEVMEERDIKNSFFSFGAANAPWIQVPSPYILDDQSLRSLIRVKAVDKAGNEYVATLLPQNTSPDPLQILLLVLVVAAVLGVLIVGWLFWQKRRRISSVT